MASQRTGAFLRSLWRPWALATLACLVYALAVVAHYDNPLALATIGWRSAPPDLTLDYYSEEGYDGQFVYYIARDPTSAAAYIDVPAYRFQRILLAVPGMLAGLLADELIVWALLATNLIALAVGTALLEGLLVDHKLSRWYAIGYGLSLGTFGAARLLTTETLAYGLVIGAIVLNQRGRWTWAALIFALAALAKETTLIFPAVYGLWWLLQRQWVKAFGSGVIALAPFVIWQGVLYANLGNFGVGSGGGGATSFELLPFMGYFRILTEGAPSIFLILSLVLWPFVLLPTLWALWMIWRDYRHNRITLWTLLLGAHALLMCFVPFSTYREILGILRFIVGLQIATILYAAHVRQIRTLRNSTIWFMTSLFVILSDFGTA